MIGIEDAPVLAFPKSVIIKVQRFVCIEVEERFVPSSREDFVDRRVSAHDAGREVGKADSEEAASPVRSEGLAVKNALEGEDAAAIRGRDHDKLTYVFGASPSELRKGAVGREALLAIAEVVAREEVAHGVGDDVEF